MTQYSRSHETISVNKKSAGVLVHPKDKWRQQDACEYVCKISHKNCNKIYTGDI